MKKYIILVAGYEYQSGGNTFLALSEKRRQFLLAANRSWVGDPNVIFIRFDPKNGKIERNTSASGAGTWTLESQPFGVVNRRTQYQDGHMISGANNLMSITDIYKYIINLGATEPGSVYEFSIMSHGWFGGPILLNSTQRDEYIVGAKAEERDPFDKDGRKKDFNATNMSSADWTNFKKAFASDGYAWFWGCLFPRAYFDTVYKFMQTKEFKSKRMDALTDSDSFTVTVNSTFANDYYSVDPEFFPTDTNVKTFSATLLDLKNYLKRGMRRSYPGRFAADTGISCNAGYLGTYSDYERSYAGHPAAFPGMIVPRNYTVYGCDFTPIINFYKTCLFISEDNENRGYATYTNAQVSQWFLDVP